MSRHSANYVPLTDDRRLQVLPSISHLSGCKKHHFGAFIQDQQRLIVWDDDPKGVINRADHIVNSLVQMIWDQAEPDAEVEKPSAKDQTNGNGRCIATVEELEKGFTGNKRPTLLINPIMVGLTIALLITALGFGWRNIAQEISVDNNYIRLAILAVTPCQVFVSLFSCKR